MDPSNYEIYLNKLSTVQDFSKLLIYLTNNSTHSFVSKNAFFWNQWKYHEKFASIDWLQVLNLLDQPEFYIGDIRAFKTLVEFYACATRGQVLPLEPFLSTNWKNGAGQISLIRHVYLALTMNITEFKIPELKLDPILTAEIIQETTQNLSTRQVATSVWLKSIWNAQPLVRILMQRAQWIAPSRDDEVILSRILATNVSNNQGNHGKFEKVEEMAHLPLISAAVAREEAKWMLDWASRQATELVTIGLIQLKHPWSHLHKDVVSKLLTLFLIGHSSSSFVLNRAWNVLGNQEIMETEGNILLDAMMDVWRKDMNRCSRILDVVIDIKALNIMMETKKYPFIFDLAALATRREYLNLGKWMDDRLKVEGEPFIQAMVTFIRLKMLHVAATNNSNNPNVSIPLVEDVLTRFLKFLSTHVETMKQETIALYKEVQTLIVQLFPHLANLFGTLPKTTINPLSVGEELTNVQFPPEIEEKANAYYERIYTGDLSVSQLTSLLRSLQTGPSSTPQTKQVFACMLHNLFDEFKFISKYPDRELILTGELFGTLILEGFVEDVSLGVALRMVLDAVKKPSGSKLFRFGVVALERFKPRLKEWSQYCAHLAQVKHLMDALPDLINYLDINGLSGEVEQKMKKPQHPLDKALSSHNEQNQVSVPDEATHDRILFILNNMTIENVIEKAIEFRNMLTTGTATGEMIQKEEGQKPPYYHWFSNYLVKRLASEPNFHGLYLALLKALALPLLEKALFKETLHHASELLKSEKLLTVAQERNNLKNLGSWVGAMTLARDKPIKFIDLAVKELLIEGYRSERLFAAIPFVCKVLEQTKDSKVFKPPNPWLMAVLRLLVELYTFAELKLTLKFEIEVMCKNLSIELKDIEPTNILNIGGQEDEGAYQEMGYQNYSEPSMESNRSQNYVSQQQNNTTTFAAPTTANIQPNLSQVQVLFDDSGNITSIPNMAAFISFQSNPAVYLQHPHLKKIVLVAMERAIREILVAVIERSIGIAGVATKELILKDFAAEMHEDRMKRAASAMGSYLAGSLANVTSREPFRVAMTSHLRSLFGQQGIHESILDSLVISTVNDNTELGCTIVEKAAIEKSIYEVNDALSSAYSARKRQRERGLPWVEVSPYPNSPFASLIPEQLKLKPGNPRQMRVYEDFIRQPGLAEKIVPEPVEPVAPVNPYNQIYEKFTELLTKLDTAIRNSSVQFLSSLPGDDEIIAIVRQINVAASQVFVRDDLALWFSQKLVRFLFQCDLALGIEIYIILLERICEISKRVATELTMWMLFSDDERKFNVNVTAALIQSGLLNILELDTYLAKQIESGKVVVVEFGAKLIHKCLCSEPQIVTYTEVYYSMDALAKLSIRKRIPESLNNVFEDLKKKAPGLFFPIMDPDYIQMREELIYLFDEWVRILQISDDTALMEKFIEKLVDRNIFDDEDRFSMFIRHSAEATIDTYLKLKNTPNGGLLSYQVADAFSKLAILFLTKFPVDSSSTPLVIASIRVDRFSRILSIISLVMIHVHEIRREHFDQRPFFRFFSSLLFDLLDSEDPGVVSTLPALLNAIANTLHVLRPLFMPGFLFGWLQLVSHSKFMPKLLQLPNQEGWHAFQRLMMDLFEFMGPFLKHGEMTDPIRMLYKGTLRVLLILLHDFPEFLCHYHFSFCDAVPATCIQLRNLILSAFPRNMRLPDPFTPNLKVDTLPETNRSPTILSDYKTILRSSGLLSSMDSYLKLRAPETFPFDLKEKMMLSPNEMFSAGTKFNVPLINASVLYLCVHSLDMIQSKGPNVELSSQMITQGPAMDVFQSLLTKFDTEGRYHLLNAITNHLRYPNSHTHYFSCVLLYLFSEANQDEIKEQITRVLLERLIVNRPHPWGLLITFIELMKNKRYAFWDHGFTRCAPDIERLFDSVARSCMIPSGIDRGSA